MGWMATEECIPVEPVIIAVGIFVVSIELRMYVQLWL